MKCQPFLTLQPFSGNCVIHSFLQIGPLRTFQRGAVATFGQLGNSNDRMDSCVKG